MSRRGEALNGLWALPDALLAIAPGAAMALGFVVLPVLGLIASALPGRTDSA